jgi:hypothetical protein
MAKNLHKDQWRKWARLVVWFGYTDTRAAECVGLDAEELADYNDVQFTALAESYLEKINIQSRAVVEHHAEHVLFEYPEAKLNIDKLIPFDFTDVRRLSEFGLLKVPPPQKTKAEIIAERKAAQAEEVAKVVATKERERLKLKEKATTDG